MILVTGDIHSKQFKEHSIMLKKGYNSRLDYCLQVFDLIEVIVKETGVDTVIINGDLFDTRRVIDVVVYTETFKKIRSLAEMVKVFLLVGNHDMYIVHSLIPFGSIENCSIIDKPMTKLINGKKLVFIPYIEDEDKLGKTLLAAPSGEALFGHFSINTAIAPKSLCSIKNLIDLQELGVTTKFKKIFLNHFHNFQQVYDNTYYVGAPLQHTNADAADKKFMVLYDPDNDTMNTVETTDMFPRFRNFHLTETNIEAYKKFEKECSDVDYVEVTTDIRKKAIVEGIVSKDFNVIEVIEEKPVSRIELPDKPNIYDLLESYVKYLKDTDTEELLSLGIEIVENYKKNNLVKEGNITGALTLNKVYFQNFFSFQDYVEIDLTRKGIFRIEGISEDANGGESNGAGKSTYIVEAIMVALTGSPLRQVEKIDELVNSVTEKDCLVGIIFYSDGIKYEIKRYRNHTQFGTKTFLFCNGKDISGPNVQEFIDDIISMSKEVISYSIVSSPSLIPSFSSLTDSDQKKRLDDVFGITSFNLDSYLKEVKSSLKLKRSTLEDFKKQLISEETKLEALKENISFYEGKLLKVEEEITYLLKDSKDIVKENKDKVATYTLESNTLKLNIKTLLKALDTLNIKEDSKDFKTEQRKYENQMTSIDADINNNSKSIMLYEDKQHNLENFNEGMCDKCGAEIKAENKAKLFKEWEAFIKNFKDTIAKLEKSKLPVQGSLSASINEQRMFDKVNEERRTKIFNKHQEISKAEERLNYVGSMINKLTNINNEFQTSLNNKSNIKDEYVQLLEKCKKEMLGKFLTLKAIKASISETWLLTERLSFWEIAFSNTGIKSFLYDSYLPVLNNKMSQFLSVFNQGSSRVVISNRTQIGTGEMREKFSVKLESPNGAKSYGACSNGQKTRIDVANMLATNRITQTISKKDLGILILDEIDNGLDKEGKARVINAIRELHKEIPLIFVISHSDDIKEYIDEEIVIKLKNGVSYVES